jgi:hypothetical protein
VISGNGTERPRFAAQARRHMDHIRYSVSTHRSPQGDPPRETIQFSPERIEVTCGTLDLRTLVANRWYRFDSDNVVPGVSLKSAVACTRVLSEIPFH